MMSLTRRMIRLPKGRVMNAGMDSLVRSCVGEKLQKAKREVFEGVRAVNEKDGSERLIKFTSLNLALTNCKDVYESLEKFVEGVDEVTGEKLSTSFKELPPVLQFSLARFTSGKIATKVNTKYEYPYQLDLDRDNRKYWSSDVERSIPNLYTLNSVIVHSGGAEDGKHYAIIKPTMKNVWLKLEGQNITRVDIRRALDENFGGDTGEAPFVFQKEKSALMLIYVRDGADDNMVFDIDEKFLTEHVNLKENEMQEESLIIRVCVDNDHDKDCTFEIPKEATFESFKDNLAEYFGVEEHRLRFYTSEAASSLVLSRSYSGTVEQVVKCGTVILKFDTKPGITGMCDMCPRRNLDEDDVLDLEDYGQEPRVNKPRVSKSSANVTKKPSKRNK